MDKVIQVQSPSLKEYYNKDLLNSPKPKLRETSEHLWMVYLYIRDKMKRRKHFEKQEKEFLRLYDEVKEKEKERQTEKNHRTQEFLYRFPKSNRNYSWVFERLKCSAIWGSFFSRIKNNDISKT